MNVILNCTVEGGAVPALTRKRPLALTPFLGATVLEQALAGYAAAGAKRVRLAATHGLEDIRRVVGRGEAWGLEVEFGKDAAATKRFVDARAFELDALPQLPERPLWRSYRGWYGVQLALLPQFATQRVGMKELATGVFVGLRSQIASDARLVAPCWIGANVFLGPGAVIGPGAIVEDGSYVDAGAEVTGSIIGPHTYVGKFTEVRDSFAWGGDLLQLDTGSLTQVVDRFLLGDLQPRRPLLDVFRTAAGGSQGPLAP